MVSSFEPFFECAAAVDRVVIKEGGRVLLVSKEM